MFTVNFANMADNDGYTLAELFPEDTAGLVPASGSGSADYVTVWDPEANAGAGGYVATYWYYKGSRASEFDYKWVKSAKAAADIKIKSGMGLWFYHRVPVGSPALTFSVAGQVEYSQQGASVTLKHGMNMIGAPFAADCDLNDLGVDFWTARVKSGEALAASGSGSADYVSIWDPLANSGTGGYSATYWLYKGNRASEFDYKWVQSAKAAAPAGFMKMGQGVWYNSRGTGFTMVLPYPYDL